MKEPLVRAAGSVSSRAVHAFSSPDRDFSFHLSFRTCCNASKSHITLSYTPINTKTFASWRNWLLWKMGIGSRCYRWPFHIEIFHQRTQPEKLCFFWRGVESPQPPAQHLVTWVFWIFLASFSITMPIILPTTLPAKLNTGVASTKKQNFWDLRKAQQHILNYWLQSSSLKRGRPGHVIFSS